MTTASTRRAENLRGMLLMIGGMASIASADAAIKAVSSAASPPQIITIFAFGGMVIFGTAARRRGIPLLTRMIFHRTVVARTLFEAASSFGFVLALSLVPLSLVTTIAQSVPLIVTLGAVLLIGERADWRAWAALSAGFAGMLIIVRPGLEGFTPTVLIAVVAVVALSARDLASRATPANVQTLQLLVWSFTVIAVLGLIVSVASGRPAPPVTLPVVAGFGAIIALTGVAFYSVTAAMRVGEVAVVSPFRYTRLVFGVLLGVIFFGERLDALTITGGVIIVASGLFIWYLQIRK